MLIYIFLEHYPNPYKPYIDTQLVYLAKSKHKIKIIAGGKFYSAINVDLDADSLIKKTSYAPNTLKNIPRFLLKISFKILTKPARSKEIFLLSYKMSTGIKSVLMHFIRMLLLPDESPDLCLLHNLSTVKSYPYLKLLFDDANIFLYYHGGELPMQISIDNAKALFSNVNHVFTNTNASKKATVKRGCDPDMVTVCPVGFNIDDFPLTNKTFRNKSFLSFVSIGRLSEEKGHIYALEAFNILKNSGHKSFHYTIVGDGYLRRNLERYVNDCDLIGFVTFVGEKNKGEVINILHEVDALILPSIELENCVETQACVVQEAMLMGLPVITTTVGGVPESIPTELQGFAVPPNDPEELVLAIKKISSLDNVQLQKLGQIGRKYVESNYSIEHVTKVILDAAD